VNKARHTKIKGLIFVVSGPSGSGKTTLLEGVLRGRALKNCLAKSISFTTRKRRSGEKHGKDYFFISDSLFKRKLKAKKILEWTKYLDHYYGTPKDFAKSRLKSNKHLALCLDLRGARWLKKNYPKNTISIFVKSASLGILRKRIATRCSTTKSDEIKRRMSMAKKELKAAKKLDYLLLNKNLARVTKELKDIILAEIHKYEERYG